VIAPNEAADASSNAAVADPDRQHRDRLDAVVATQEQALGRQASALPSWRNLSSARRHPPRGRSATKQPPVGHPAGYPFRTEGATHATAARYLRQHNGRSRAGVHDGRAFRHDHVRGSESQSVPDRARPRLVCGDQPAMPRWRLVSRPVRVPGRSERCSSALGADPWLRRARSVPTRSTSACQRVERRRCAPGPLAEQAPCRCSCLPHGRPSPWRTSQAVWTAPLAGDPDPGRARAPPGARRAARAVQPWPEQVPTGARAGVRGADRPRSGLGSCRTRRPAPARPGRRPQTDAIRDRCGRHGTAARRFLSRSGPLYATALSPHHRTSIAPSQ
jgi:hypothetical protein